MRRAGSCLGALLFLILFGGLGIGLSIWGWNILQNARASTAWPTAQGQVVSSEVTVSTSSEGGDSYNPQVTFVYAVNDQQYQDDTIKFGETSYGNRNRAQEVADKYPVGATVTVYYDPSDPATAVLEPGVSGGSYLILGLGVFFAVMAFVTPSSMLFFRRRR
ncbi:MAG: DUF3592 domain-containing protein [Chloroflexi bacterium]|nr:DUF3592 domain-containing protein [Chloroflexota bacterium]MCI0579858.1 DUF3592 domain-containing protein [Chloroflexota bacterium]MCI0643258.1 DUF3592 domain-containing protein [Chloroflexota bacterium]MCI0726934.1 DUF3592 domain-containing protein [Chloroflexota bacterium]